MQALLAANPNLGGGVPSEQANAAFVAHQAVGHPAGAQGGQVGGAAAAPPAPAASQRTPAGIPSARDQLDRDIAAVEAELARLNA